MIHQVIQILHSMSELIFSEQTFVLMKTSFVFLFRTRLQDVLIKTNIFALVIRFQKTSLSRPTYSSLPYVCKKSSRRFQDLFNMSCQDVCNTSSRRLAETSSRHLQEIFKSFCRRRQDIFKTSWKDVFKTFPRRIIRLDCLRR